MRHVGLTIVLMIVAFPGIAESKETDDSDTARVEFVLGAQVTTPQKLSVSGGAIVALGRERFRSSEGKGLLLQLEPGLGGIKGSVGMGELQGGHGGWSARLSVLRTWGDPWVADSGETYIGPELTVAPYIVKLGMGALYRVSGTQRNDWILTAGLGVGF